MSPLFSPVSAGGIGKATVTASTGSPTIDSATRAVRLSINLQAQALSLLVVQDM